MELGEVDKTLFGSEKLSSRMTRKADRYEYIRHVKLSDLPPEVGQAIDELERFEAADVLVRADWPLSDLSGPKTIWFVLIRNGIEYLVNTSGSCYCRYMAEIIDDRPNTIEIVDGREGEKPILITDRGPGEVILRRVDDGTEVRVQRYGVWADAGRLKIEAIAWSDDLDALVERFGDLPVNKIGDWEER